MYGNRTPLPAREDAPAVAPVSPYAATKRGAELMASALMRGVERGSCAALRFFTVYGPRRAPGDGHHAVRARGAGRRPITLFGDGSMRRDFTHVDDIVRGILAVAASDVAPASAPTTSAPARPSISGRWCARSARPRASAPTWGTRRSPLGDVDATFADISRARESWVGSRQVKLAEGLATVVDWVKRHPA